MGTRTVATPARNGGSCDLSESNTRETRTCPDRFLPNLEVLASNTQAKCPPRSATAQANCGPPPLLQNGKLSRIGSCDFPGGFATYECNPAYRLMGASFVWCEGTGDWSTPLPLCFASVGTQSGNETNAETEQAQVASLQSLLGFLQNVYYSRYGTVGLTAPSSQSAGGEARSQPLTLATTRGGGNEVEGTVESLESRMREELPKGAYDSIKDALVNEDWDELAM